MLPWEPAWQHAFPSPSAWQGGLVSGVSLPKARRLAGPGASSSAPPSPPLEGRGLPGPVGPGLGAGRGAKRPGRGAPVAPDLGYVPSCVRGPRLPRWATSQRALTGPAGGHTAQKQPVPSCWRCTFLISDLLFLCSKQTNFRAPNIGRAPVGNWPSLCLRMRAPGCLPPHPSGQTWGLGGGGREWGGVAQASCAGSLARSPLL